MSSAWFVVNVRDAEWESKGEFGVRCRFESPEERFAHFGITVQVLSSSSKGYRVHVTRTSLSTQGLPVQIVQPGGAVQSQENLAPPQAPLSAISLPFGIGWDLGPLEAG